MNSLADLNAILFDQIQKIQNDDATDEELEKEIKKSEAITKLSSQVLSSAKSHFKLRSNLMNTEPEGL